MPKPNPHLALIRRAHALTVKGGSLREVAKHLGVSKSSIQNYLKEYHERRKAGTLFEDLNREIDIYAHPSIQR
jgi:transposase